MPKQKYTYVSHQECEQNCSIGRGHSIPLVDLIALPFQRILKYKLILCYIPKRELEVRI